MSQTLKALAGVRKGGGGDSATGVSFDGVSDYMSRSSDLVGNTDSKTFTFSCWVYEPTAGARLFMSSTVGGEQGFQVKMGSTGVIITAHNTSGDSILSATPTVSQPLNTWYLLSISIDLSDTNKRHIFVGDTDVTSLTTWTTYVDDVIDFTQETKSISAWEASAQSKNRLSNLFLDYTYRDLSIEANRRLFITADGKPAEGLESVDKYVNNTYDASSLGTVYGFTVSKDGSKLYMADDTSNAVYQYSLAIPFQVYTATSDGISFDVSAKETGIRAIDIMDDGKTFYIYGTGSDSVHQYEMGTILDVSTSVFVGTINVSAQGDGYGDMKVKNNGTKMYHSGSGTKIWQYTMSVAYDITTATYDGTSLSMTDNAQGFDISLDGTQLIYETNANSTVDSFTLNTPFDVTSAVYNNSFSCLGQVVDISRCVLSADNLLINNGTEIFTYNLVDAYDISTATYGAKEGNPQQPILYLPMVDKATAHINRGTGGDMVQNGLLETADRGAGQDNAVCSEFDGSDDGLSTNATNLGITNGKVATISTYLKQGTVSDIAGAFYMKNVNTNIFSLYKEDKSSLTFYCNAAGNITIARFETSDYIPNEKGLYIQASIDLTDVNKRHFIINGAEANGTWTTYINDTIDFINASEVTIGNQRGYDEDITTGELYFDTNYIDLATDNPFWDSDTNKPIPVRKAMSNLGSNPLICSPISADNPTANYGSGGQWTLNGGGLLGARGASEFISRSALFSSNPDSSFSNANIGAGQETKATMVLAYKPDVTNSSVIVNCSDDGTSLLSTGFYIEDNQGGLEIAMYNATRDYKLNYPKVTYTVGSYNLVFFSFDYTAHTEYFSLNGAVQTPTNFIQGSIVDMGGPTSVGGNLDNSISKDGSIAYLYLVNDYIDFSQEANRNLFVNQLGYPRDLTPLIDEGTIPTPLIYMKFDDTDNLGKNEYGTDFTVNGTVTAGADFKL